MTDRKKYALIFGSNEYAVKIANSVKKEYEVTFFVLSEAEEIAFEGNFTKKVFNLSDEWYNIEELEKNGDVIVFCALEDESENVFLAISLRSKFATLPIVAIAKNKEGVNKLKMAGANKVIAIEQTVAEIIADIVHNPIASKVLREILYEKSNLKLVQIEVENAEVFKGQVPTEIDWSRYGVIALSIMHKDLSTEFIYSSKAKRNELKNGDMIVVVGYEADIAELEKMIGSRKYGNWSDWSW